MVLTLKTPWRDNNTHILMSSLELMQRQAALVSQQQLQPRTIASRLSIFTAMCAVWVDVGQCLRRSACRMAVVRVQRPGTEHSGRPEFGHEPPFNFASQVTAPD